MNYQDYIDIGFTRLEINDSTEFKRTGYTGFVLTKEINQNMSVEVCNGELDKPKLYIKKNEPYCHIIQLTGEMVKDMFKKL